MLNLNYIEKNRLANQIAWAYLSELCRGEAIKRFKDNLIYVIKQETEEKPRPNAELFEALFKAIDPYQKKFKSMVEDVWDWERKTIIANIKKMRKEWMRKDAIDEMLYPKAAGAAKLQEGSVSIYIETLKSGAETEIERYDFGIAFDVESDEVKDWLKTYIPIFSESLEDVSLAKLRTELEEGIKAGEGVRELTARVNKTYENWYKYRSENIARSEVIRGSNKGALEIYRQSGIVKKKIWITFFDRRTCPHCERLDGEVIELEKNFFDLGDTVITQVEEEGKLTTHKMDINYTYIDAPPLHSMCRCAVSAYFEE